MDKTRRHSLIALLLCVLTTPTRAVELDIETATPLATIETLQRGLIAVAAASDLSVEDRYERLHPLITATHDLEYIATLAVRRQWDQFEPAQQSRYLAAFEALSVMSYASRFVDIGDDSFVMPSLGNVTEDAAEVTSAIRRAAGGDVSFDYALRRVDDAWRIINIVADGVSDLALKRAEYRRILSEQSVDALIAEIERQTDDLRH